MNILKEEGIKILKVLLYILKLFVDYLCAQEH